MKKKNLLFVFILIIISGTHCIKETYNMDMFSKKMHLKPGMAISAVKGNASLNDLIHTNDTVVFDQNQLLRLIFRRDSIVDLKLNDFSKAVIQKTAVIDPGTVDLNIKEILDHLTGSLTIVNPVIKFNYTNSFADSLKVNMNINAQRKNVITNLNLAPFKINKPDLPLHQEISSTFTIDKTNSNLPQLISLLPELINYSGNVILTTLVKDNQAVTNAIGSNRLVGSMQVELPMELKINNLQFRDTVDNFLKQDKKEDSQINPEDFEYLRIIINAQNGLPLGISVKISLLDSATQVVKSTVSGDNILSPAAVDSNGRVTATAESSVTIELTRDFFNNVNKADKIIFIFTLNTTGSGSQEVKIYSDYTIDFKAALVVKPDIDLN